MSIRVYAARDDAPEDGSVFLYNREPRKVTGMWIDADLIGTLKLPVGTFIPSGSCMLIELIELNEVKIGEKDEPQSQG